jgi:D-threonate/D-erythronate kinase
VCRDLCNLTPPGGCSEHAPSTADPVTPDKVRSVWAGCSGPHEEPAATNREYTLAALSPPSSTGRGSRLARSPVPYEPKRIGPNVRPVSAADQPALQQAQDEPVRLLILADDFTGASDAAGPFAAAGRETLVVLSATDSRELWDRVDVLAVDLDLRECTDPQAHRKTEAVARRLCSTSKAARVFLKIDSTLRGPIAGLVSGALTGSGKDIAVIAPAFPEQGRFLHEGRLVVDGQPGGSLTAKLGMDGTALLGARFASPAEEVEHAVEHARLRGARRVVVDTGRSDNLQSVAGAWRRHADWLLVGSSGLARQAAEPARPPEHAVHLPSVTRPVLVIAGSPSPITRAQIDHLRPTASVTMVAARMAAPSLPPLPQDLLVVCTPSATERDAGESAAAIADTVAEWSKDLLPAAVVLAGGATARGVCEGRGVRGVRLSGEFRPGVPIGRLVGGVWDGVRVVTKAGGFGASSTLLDVVRALGG